jgi:putative two-component system response regulator
MAEVKPNKQPSLPNNHDVNQPQKVLIVDDNHANLELLKVQLKPYKYQLETAVDGEDALEKVYSWVPDLILLDLMMPKKDGYEVCKTLKNDKDYCFIPIIIVTALRELDDKIKAIDAGADDFLIKPFNKVELITRVKSLLRMKMLYDDLDSSENILFSMVHMLEERDEYTRGHSERVAHFSVKVAEKLGLTGREIDVINRGSLLHDIGKVGIREHILTKPGKLTPEEVEHINTHPAKGYEICKRLKSLAPALPIIRSHHERMDGTGYPDQLPAEEIQFYARIVAITDSYDAMTSNRPYRRGLSALDAIKIIDQERDSGQWDPELISPFIEVIKELKKIRS